MNKNEKLRLKHLSDSRLSRTRSNLIEARDLDENSCKDEFSSSSERKLLEEKVEKELSRTKSIQSIQSTASKVSRKSERISTLRIKTRTEILEQNQFLSDYDAEKELQSKNDTLLAKVRINASKASQSMIPFLKHYEDNIFSQMEDRSLFSWEFCKLYQFFEMNKLREDIIKSIMEANRLLSSLSANATIVENLYVNSPSKLIMQD
ncbi:unnamed protein product [Dimorphilus gyrociliatus]|uniref:Uncharacterized protein n=1 Tax=Dimorphilus gyrociliatus TaxID=2664684 RepID=A0A7I8VJN6_9ANNE|nr:unnamed protein product [Dimorphilus gyrociliatus]